MATQIFHCVLCQEDFASVEDFNSHEKQELHRKEFERRMDGTSIGLLLCKCCFISVPTLKAWDDHVKSKGHVKLVGQSEFLGKRCVWQVPGVKMKDGSIKLCKDIKQLFDSGWKDPDYVQKVTTQGALETDLIIGMNCITLKTMVNDLPMYHCSLCCVDFHHNDRNHVVGRLHRINVVWNWEKKTADRIAKGLDFPKASTRAKAQAELEEVTRKIFKMEQDCLDDDQFDLYQVMATKKLPSDLGKVPANCRQLAPRRTTSGEGSRTNDEPDQIVNVRSRSRTPSEPPNKKSRDSQRSPSKNSTKQQSRGTNNPQKSQSKSSTENIHQHQAINLSPPRPLPKLSTGSDMPPSSNMPSFSSTFREVETIQMAPEIRAELELFDLMDELQLSGNFKPPESAKSSDPTKLLNMLYTLGEGLLEYQTKKREIPMELPRDDIKEITNAIGSIENIIKGLSGDNIESDDKSTVNENESNNEVAVTS